MQGENLLQYFDAHAYSVKVGDKECTELTVVNNLITCKPPQDEPDIYSEVQVILSFRERHKILCHSKTAFTWTKVKTLLL